MKSPLAKLRSDHLVILAGVALLAGAVVVFGRPEVSGADPKDVFQGSSNYTSPSGTRAFHDLLAELESPVSRTGRTADRLPADVGVLFLLAPGHPPDEKAMDALVAWVERGGTLIWAPRRTLGAAEAGAVLRRFGLDAEARTGDPEPVEGTLEPLGGVGRSYRLLAGGAWSVVKGAGVPLAGGVAALAAKGRGRFVALADLDLVANGGLKREEHAEFAVHLAILAARGRRLAFDEYHHGFREGDSAASLLLESPLGPAAGVLLLTAFAAIYARGRRLGPPRDARDERRRRPTEALDAFAGVAGRLRAAPQAMGLILAEFESWLERRLGTSALPRADQAAVRAGLEPGQLSEALEAARAVAASRADEAAFLHVSRRLEGIRRRLAKQRRTKG